MKKILAKIYSMALAVAMTVSLCSTMALAAIPDTSTTNTFTLAAPETGDMQTNWNYYGNGYAPAEEVENELFNKVYRFMYHPGGYPNWANVYMKFDLDIPERTSTDGIYISFYYKAASEFMGTDGQIYTSASSISVPHIRDASERLLNLQTQGLGDFAFVADDQWHKIEAYVPSEGRFSDNALYIYNSSLATMDVMIADVRVGVLDMTAYNNDVCYTQMGWYLKEMSAPTALSVNGQALDISGAQTEFTVEADVSGVPEVVMAGSDYIVTKLADNKYQITAVAPGYNKALGDDADVMYRERWTGSAYTGSINQITVKNSTLKGNSYIVNLDVEETDEVSPFTLAPAEEGNMETSWNFYGEGSVPPVELKNDLFDKAYKYMYCLNENNPSWPELYMKFDLDIPERKSTDGIYVSFYYKAASRFRGMDGTMYTSPSTISMAHIRDASERLLNLQTQGLGDFTFVADDQWHKIEAYVPADGRFSDNALYMYNSTLATMDVMIADIRVGVLDMRVFNNDACYTQMGWYLKEMNPTALSVNGQALDLSGAQTEVTVKTSEMAKPKISITGSDYMVTKLANDKYQITAIAAGYNKALGDDGDVMYRERWNGSAYAGSFNEITVKNGTLKGDSYIVNLEYDEGFYVDGEKVGSGEQVPAGKVYCYKKSFAKPEDGTLVALIAAYEKGTHKLVDVSKQEYTFKADETAAHVSIDMTKDNSEDTLYFKVFILDGFDDLEPLMGCKSTASITVS